MLGSVVGREKGWKNGLPPNVQFSGGGIGRGIADLDDFGFRGRVDLGVELLGLERVHDDLGVVADAFHQLDVAAQVAIGLGLAGHGFAQQVERKRAFQLALAHRRKEGRVLREKGIEPGRPGGAKPGDSSCVPLDGSASEGSRKMASALPSPWLPPPPK